GVTPAGRIRGPVVLGVPRVLDVETPLAGEQLAVPRVACRQHAIEQIHSPGNRLDEVRGGAGAHEIARAVLWQALRGPIDHVVHDLRRLADAETANRVGLEPYGDRFARTFLTQVRKHTALHDAKLRLAGIRHGDAGHQPVAEGEEPIASAARPAERALHRLPRRRL